MKIKKALMTIISLFLIVSIVGCSTLSGETISIPNTEKNTNNSGNIDDFITTEYDEAVFFQTLAFYSYPVPAGFLSLRTIEHWEDATPAECIRKTDEDSFYVVYKTTQGGLCYIFYRIYNGYAALSNCIYSKEELSYRDIKDIKVGDDISKLEDKVTFVKAFVESQYSSDRIALKIGVLLTDGIIFFTVTKGENAAVTITDIEYEKDYVIDYPSGDSEDSNTIPISYKILDKDRI